MRTLLLVGIAGLAALAADAAQANDGPNHQGGTRTERRVIVVDAAGADDAAVYRSSDDRALAESDYRGRWQGEWDGRWDADGARYRGTYEGEYDAYGADYRDPHRDNGARRHDERDLARICRRDSGAGGAAIGAVVGGLAGNRIAGRGSRTEGTLIGAGVGAVAGLAIDRSEDARACADYWRRIDTSDHARTGGYRHDGDRYASYGYDGYGYGGGTTVVVIPGQPIIIEETETTYETVAYAAPRARHAPRRAAPRHRAPRPRPHCTCR